MIHYCYTCGNTNLDFDMDTHSEWNPDARRWLDFIQCPCGEYEDITEAYACDECGDYFPRDKMESGTDLCLPCFAIEDCTV